MRTSSPMAVGLAALLCGCPIISEDLANQKTMLPVEDTATNEGDVDGDGYTTEQGDCDDNDPNISPTVTDDLGDGVDQNCDGVDGVDRDGDGWASQQSGGLDCNDEEPATHPEAPDPGSDEIDQNCDGVDGTDGDADGYASKESGGLDCDDTDPTVGDCSICNSRSTPSYALSFDGINDRVEIGTAPTLVGLGSAVTVETWIRVVDDNDSYCGILIEATGSTPFMLCFHGYQDWEYVRVRFSTDDDAVAVETEEGTVLPDTWQHLLATYDGSAVRVYLDGVLASEAALQGNIRDATGATVLGARPANINYYYEGELHDVRVWTRVLFDEEIACRATHGEPGNQSGLLAAWHMNEGTGTVLSDSSGNGLGGSIEGASWVAY